MCCSLQPLPLLLQGLYPVAWRPGGEASPGLPPLSLLGDLSLEQGIVGLLPPGHTPTLFLECIYDHLLCPWPFVHVTSFHPHGSPIKLALWSFLSQGHVAPSLCQSPGGGG